MIVSVFFPERIGSYYLFKRRHVGIEITDRTIYATVMTLAGRSRTIEAVYQEKIDQESTVSFDERVIKALGLLRPRLGTYHIVSCTLSSSQVIFKDITLPFIGLRKAKLVVPFEAEALLPFNLEDGVLDSVVAHEDTQKQETHLIVAALKKEGIEQIEYYFKEAGIQLDRVSVDIFDLYGIYTQLSNNKKKSTALISLGATRTTLGIIINGKLSSIRSFSHGLVSHKKEVPQKLIFDAATKKQLTKILEDIAGTVQVTLPKLVSNGSLEKIILTGMATDLTGIKKIVSTALGAPVKFMSPEIVIHAGLATSTVDHIPGAYSVSMAAAYSPPITQEFTFLQEKALAQENQRMNYQIISVAILTSVMFLSFSLFSFLRGRTLKKAYKASETEAINTLKRAFKLRPGQVINLEKANKTARADLKRQETAWRRISPDNRYAYIKYLTGLTNCIDMQESQLKLKSIILKDDTIKLYGSVPGYPQLNKLQNQLECPLFKRVPKLQDKNFMSEPITLIINPEEL